MTEVKSNWEGTMQHAGASDLSRWLIHLTRSEEDLISILKSGMIEARRPYGAGSTFSIVREVHRSVCFTEIPLHELGRMTAKRPWGIVFDKERLRTKFNAQPVWYVSDPSPQWEALGTAMREARNSFGSPIWKLTPYIDRVRSLRSSRPHDWRWEREWRVRGSFEFDLDDIAMIVADHEGAPAFFEEVSVGLPWVSPDDSIVRWSGGFTAGWRDEIEGMLERFYGQFIPADEAGLIWDRETGDYFAMVPLLETPDAMEEAFGHLVLALQRALERTLDRTNTVWCRRYDLSHIDE